MLLDGLGWSHYSVFAPCIMTQTRVLGRSGGGIGELGRTGRDETCYSTPLWLRRFTAGFDLAVHSLV